MNDYANSQKIKVCVLKLLSWRWGLRCSLSKCWWLLRRTGHCSALSCLNFSIKSSVCLIAASLVVVGVITRQQNKSSWRFVCCFDVSALLFFSHSVFLPLSVHFLSSDHADSWSGRRWWKQDLSSPLHTKHFSSRCCMTNLITTLEQSQGESGAKGEKKIWCYCCAVLNLSCKYLHIFPSSPFHYYSCY